MVDVTTLQGTPRSDPVSPSQVTGSTTTRAYYVLTVPPNCLERLNTESAWQVYKVKPRVQTRMAGLQVCT